MMCFQCVTKFYLYIVSCPINHQIRVIFEDYNFDLAEAGIEPGGGGASVLLSELYDPFIPFENWDNRPGLLPNASAGLFAVPLLGEGLLLLTSHIVTLCLFYVSFPFVFLFF